MCRRSDKQAAKTRLPIQEEAGADRFQQTDPSKRFFSPRKIYKNIPLGLTLLEVLTSLMVLMLVAGR